MGVLIGGLWSSWRAAWKRPPGFWQRVGPHLSSWQSRQDFTADVTTTLRTAHASTFCIRFSLVFFFFNWTAFRLLGSSRSSRMFTR